jgi:hypothetical protein
MTKWKGQTMISKTLNGKLQPKGTSVFNLISMLLLLNVQENAIHSVVRVPPWRMISLLIWNFQILIWCSFAYIVELVLLLNMHDIFAAWTDNVDIVRKIKEAQTIQWPNEKDKQWFPKHWTENYNQKWIYLFPST